MSYATKDTISEATRPGCVYGTDPGPARPVRIAPAESEVGPLERAARDAYVAELTCQSEAVTDPELSREILARARRVLGALPVLELFDRVKRIKQAKDDLSDVGGLEGIELRAGLDASARKR